MASQIVTKVIVILSIGLASAVASAHALESVETQDIIAQLKALYEVEGNSPDRCEHLVMHRPHYKKVLEMMEQQKQTLRESARSLASLGFFAVFSSAAGEVKNDQLKDLELAEEKYGCMVYRRNMNMIPSHGNSFEQ